MRRDENQQVLLLFDVRRRREQPANQRQLIENRNALFRLGHRRLREPADHRRLPIADQELVVRVPLLEVVPQVAAHVLDRRLLGVQRHEHLPVARDVRRHLQNDTNFLELHGGDRRRALSRRVQHADRDFLADLDLGHAIVERHDARLRLHVGEVRLLERIDERRQRELPEGDRVDQVER